MQQLHLVGFTTDHKGLILGTRRGTEEGSFVVTLDRALVEHIEELLRLQAGESPGGDPSATSANGTAVLLRRPKAESKLTPREVQSLLRTGSSVSEVAEAAGMSEDWVGRFAPPVLAEQARVVERAAGLVYTKPKIGPSLQPLAESVMWNLAERGIILSGPAFDDAWSAFQQPDGGWVVRVSYLAERRRQHADWTIDMGQGALKAVNRLANELGYVEPGRRRPTALPPAAPVSASAQRAASAPPKPPTPPPLPPRPSGRLSLLGTGVGGVTRSNPPPSRPPPPLSPPPRASAPPPPVPSRPLERRREPEPPARTSKRLPKDFEAPPPEPEDQPSSRPRRQPPGERRERPLRPLGSRGRLVPPDDEQPPPRPSGADDPAVAPPPRRERPLRAPSRIRRDELAGPAPSPSRSPSGAPRDDGSRGTGSPAPAPSRRAPFRSSESEPRQPPSSSLSDAGPHRFGPSQSAGDRTVSTAERFGVGRSAVAVAVALADGPAPVTAEEPAPAPAPAGSLRDRRPSATRPLRARPLRAPALADPDDAEPDLDPETEPDPEPDDAGATAGASFRAEEVYQAFTRLEADDPITAPVPEIEPDGADFGLDGTDEPRLDPGAGRDGVLIRAGQAGAPGKGSGRAGDKHASSDDDRQARSSRLRLRRRPPGST